MSMLSSLSVWSSVRFPFPKFYQDIKRTKTFGVESCDNLQRSDHEKVRGEKATEMVNLTVPWSQNVNKKNSVPNLYCECTRNQKKSRKKNKHVKFVTVPDIVFFEKENSVEKVPDIQTTNHEDERDLIPEDKYYECQLEEVQENDEENTCIPSVKPWTLEELTVINKEIKEREKMEIRRTKRRENILKNHIRELESFSRSLSPDDTFTSSENFTSCDRFLPFTQQFYECDRYCSKLGLNSGFTKKTHKIR